MTLKDLKTLNSDTIKVVVAMVCLTFLVSIALLTGQDGVLLGSGLSLIAALAGYFIGKPSKSNGGEK